jgi:hypothetical protein
VSRAGGRDPPTRRERREGEGAGVDGFFVKRVQRTGGEVTLTMELESVERKPLDPQLFRVPEGYARAAH